MAYMLSSTKKTSKCWEMSLICVGTGWQRLNASCNGIITVDSESVRKKISREKQTGNKNFLYGVICPNCGCFTKISNSNLIPDEVKVNAKML